ncbi:MAG TPA: FecR family protein [Candidatus Sulfotelmatobacter sp.]|nr:FecR family protein [Candidatus Sulfotelmatobacter sp.]
MPAPSRLTVIPVVLVAAACALLALPALADSQARIVRLSDVQGSVQIDKNTGLGFERAFINLPVTQGAKLRAGANGRAEVEFEDGSSLRLTPNTTLEFSKLGLADSGKRQSQVNLVEGMAYVNWLGKDDLSLNFSRETVVLDHSAHFRVDASTEAANLAVFKGAVSVDGPSGKVTVDKKKTATFDAAAEDKYTLANKVAEQPLDSWDKEAVSYHDQYARNNTTPYGYGFSDLNYYGAFSNVPGYGMMWQPYFTGVGWDPFMDGAWGYYPGFGYMFASAYPWGWMPYRYGNWMFVPGFGWMWQPGAWNSWVGVPRYTATTGVRVSPLVPPASGTVRTVFVGRGSTVTAMQPTRVTLNAGSAGLGIPRGSINHLNHLNHEVVKHGSAQVQPAPSFSASSPTSGASSSPQRGSMSGAPQRGSMSSAPPVRSSAPAARPSAPPPGGRR